jgi:hypothetical protein
MKPTMQPIVNETPDSVSNGRFPITDYNYQAVELGGYNGRCAKMANPSFHSRDYFKTEDRHYFLTEAIIFAAILATSALPLFNGAHAVIDLVRSIGGV